MKVSMKVDYGVRALTDLAQHYGKGPTQTAEIASRQLIPEPYLDQLLTTFRKAGYIKSRRGPRGGHVLAKEPEKISLGMVIETLEGSFSPIDCLTEAGECPRIPICAQRDVWKTVEEATRHVLLRTNIAELAHQEVMREGRRMYYI